MAIRADEQQERVQNKVKELEKSINEKVVELQHLKDEKQKIHADMVRCEEESHRKIAELV